MKLFCIGLPRTGTSSLTRALSILGIDTEHAPCALDLEYYERDQAAYTDTPIWVPEMFSKLAVRLPGAKFIYTYRNPADWIRSVRKLRFFTSKEMLVKPADEWAYTTVLGYPFNRKKWTAGYNRHCDDVFEFFSDKPHRLLSIDVTRGCDDRIKWSELCKFLEMPVPGVPFPHENKKRM